MFSKTTITADILKGYMASLPEKKTPRVSPSQLGGCMRAHFYKIKQVPATTPPNYGAMVNFQVGFMWEAFIAKAYQEQGKLVKWLQDGLEEPWQLPELNLQGLPDIIALDSEGEAIIVDSKTVRSEWFQYTRKYKSMDDFVRDNKAYIYQQVCYILLARANGYPKMRKAVLSFASKDDGYVGNELLILNTTELTKMVTDRIKELNGYLERDELPPCECDGWKVGYCNFGDIHTRVFNKKGKEVNTLCCSPTLYSSLPSDDAQNLKTKEV